MASKPSASVGNMAELFAQISRMKEEFNQVTKQIGDTRADNQRLLQAIERQKNEIRESEARRLNYMWREQHSTSELKEYLIIHASQAQQEEKVKAEIAAMEGDIERLWQKLNNRRSEAMPWLQGILKGPWARDYTATDISIDIKSDEVRLERVRDAVEKFIAAKQAHQFAVITLDEYQQQLKQQRSRIQELKRLKEQPPKPTPQAALESAKLEAMVLESDLPLLKTQQEKLLKKFDELNRAKRNVESEISSTNAQLDQLRKKAKPPN